jgi:RNA polymerase sigma-70 factor (ECF subfamily)
MPMTEVERLAAWRNGDAAAGEALVEANFESVYRFFRNKVDGDLDDLVQATFTRCLERRDDAEIRAFRPYLFGVARNVLREHYRRRARADTDLGNKSVADLGASPSTLVSQKRDHRMLLEALRQIPLDEQVVLELFYWESMTGRELAEVLGVPEGTARTRLRSARMSLEAALARIVRSPDALKTTLDNLERWSASIREALAAGAL